MVKSFPEQLTVGILYLTLLLGAVSCSNEQSLEKRLDAYVQECTDRGLFSGAVLVAKNGKIVLCKGYGMANYELDVPNTPQTKFRIGSISKQFTAMLIMQAQAKGLLHLTDPITKYIPNYPNGEKITIHHLLTHTSGVPLFYSFPEFKNRVRTPYTLEQVVAIIKQKPLEFEPGEKFSYSCSGYTLLTYIIEQVFGNKYETVLKTQVFDPLTMYDSGYDKSSPIIKHRASGHYYPDVPEGVKWDLKKLVNADCIETNMPFESGAGALYSTVEDLYRWDQALYTEKLLPKESLTAIFTPYQKFLTRHYGYGWWIGTFYGHTVIEHSGQIEGFCTDIRRYPEDKACIIVLSNIIDTPAPTISKGLSAIIFGEKPYLPNTKIAAAVNPGIYDQYVGKYKSNNGPIVTITKENNKLFWSILGEKTELYPESETEFFFKSFDMPVSFIKNKQGNVTQLISRVDGENQVADKIT